MHKEPLINPPPLSEKIKKPVPNKKFDIRQLHVIVR